jgi:hypothetical protein
LETIFPSKLFDKESSYFLHYIVDREFDCLYFNVTLLWATNVICCWNEFSESLLEHDAIQRSFVCISPVHFYAIGQESPSGNDSN